MPYLHPVGQTVPIWKIIGKFVKQDLTKISLPVLLNDPTNTLQKQCEMMYNYNLLEEASKSDDSCYRLCLSGIFFTIHYYFSKMRLKKPFNPILGETFEFVQDKYIFLSEQVSHHPPITAYNFQGDGFEGEGYSQVKQNFAFGGGSGCLHF